MLLACLAIQGAPARADGLPDLGETERAGFSVYAERRLGEQIMRDIRRDPAYVDDAEIAGYIAALGQRLAGHAEGVRHDLEFFVIRDAMLNAFALPGGFIGMHTGLILAARSESELAGVLAHEISHVTQSHLARMFGRQGQSQLTALLGLAVAILAARSNPDIAVGAAVTGQAAGIQQQLNYSRDFEREADRLGLEMLERAGFDPRGMASFFERMLQFGRLYENNAPGYLRTHPLTTERISDMENRIAQKPYRQVPDSLEFGLVRARLKAMEGSPGDAVADFSAQMKSGKFVREGDVRFGLAHALLRDNKLAAAEAEVAALRRLKIESPMLEGLAARLRARQGDTAGAVRILVAATERYPQARSLVYALVEAKVGAGDTAAALALTQRELQLAPGDARLHALQAKTYAALGRRAQQHRAQAEAYMVQGHLDGALEQIELARRAGDGDFFEMSQIDARLRELRQLKAEEMRRRQGGGNRLP